MGAKVLTPLRVRLKGCLDGIDDCLNRRDVAYRLVLLGEGADGFQ